MKTKFAIGCLVQWYECELIIEYLNTLVIAKSQYEGEVSVDIAVCTTQELEKAISIEVLTKAVNKINTLCNAHGITPTVIKEVYTIADYRREFNSKYCTLADVLIWGESDMLIPSQMFTTLDLLHTNTPVPKYLATFGICKMWDKSWELLEHPKFTNKPFIENDYTNWWSVKYTMTAEEMEKINSETENLDILELPQHKFNGCGLVISSEVIKAGVNIPQSVFFVHEDTAFMLMTQKILGNIPQYGIRNILVVHNRNHPLKRMYIKGETGDTMNKKRRSNGWYIKANKYSEQNCYNLFNPEYKSKNWVDVWQE
jgi:hypothetical protein